MCFLLAVSCNELQCLSFRLHHISVFSLSLLCQILCDLFMRANISGPLFLEKLCKRLGSHGGWISVELLHSETCEMFETLKRIKNELIPRVNEFSALFHAMSCYSCYILPLEDWSHPCVSIETPTSFFMCAAYSPPLLVHVWSVWMYFLVLDPPGKKKKTLKLSESDLRMQWNYIPSKINWNGGKVEKVISLVCLSTHLWWG